MHLGPNSPTDVVAAVVRRNDRYLIAKRPQNKHHGGLWEFPGGKVVPGETFATAIQRELGEELGVELAGLGSLLFAGLDPDGRFRIHFLEVMIHGEPQVLEHEDIWWANVEELSSVPLAPTDRQFVTEQLYNRARHV